MRPDSAKFFCPQNRRAQGKPGARCTRSRAWSVVNTRVSHHRFAGTPGLPCAMVLTVSFALSSVIGLYCHRRLRGVSGPLGLTSPFANLTPASRRQDHTTSPSALALSSKRRSRPPHPAPNVRDDREAPLLWRRDARILLLIWGRDQQRRLRQIGTTGKIIRAFVPLPPRARLAIPSRLVHQVLQSGWVEH